MINRIFTALSLGIAAGIARALLPDIKTRIQLAVALSLAALFELCLRRRLRQRPGIAGFALNAAAIVVATIAVKIAIDGRPHYPEWVIGAAAAMGIVL